jgi:DNA repair exonuclease SbcCD ATPase subunit
MDLTLVHFRCYRNRTFHIPAGVVLVDGPSGTGKTTLLLAIKYALFGTVKSITSFGEKKTSVELRYQGYTVIRTSIPSRLIVRTPDAEYEDDAAQAILNRWVGSPDQFDATSYMMQKDSEHFFALSGAQKLHVLEQLAFLNDQNSIKETILADSKEKRKQTEKLEHQIELLTSQLGNEPQFDYKYGFRSVADVKRCIGFLQGIKTQWEHERTLCDHELFQYTSLLAKQQEQYMAYKQAKASLQLLVDEKEHVQMNHDAIHVDPSQQLLYQSYLDQHALWERYQSFVKEMENEIRLHHVQSDMEKQAFERSEKEWEACQVDSVQLHEYEQKKSEHEKWITYQSAIREVNDLTEKCNEWVTSELQRYDRYQAELSHLKFDPAQLELYDTYILDHDQYESTKRMEALLISKKQQCESWLTQQHERYQQWKKDWENLIIDETRQRTYQSYLANHDQYEQYQRTEQLLHQRKSQFQQWLKPEHERYERLLQEKQSLTSNPVLLHTYTTQLALHQTWLTYQKMAETVTEKETWYQNAVSHAKEKHQHELDQLLSQRQESTVNVDELESERSLHASHAVIWKRIKELKQKRPEAEVDLQLDTLKKNREIMERFFSNLDARKNVYACPQCKSSLIIQSQKIQPASVAPLSEADLKKEEEYKLKLPKVIEKYDKNYREWISREEDKKELERLLASVSCTEESCSDIVVSCTMKLQEERLRQHTQEQLEKQIRVKQHDDPSILYTSQLTELTKLQHELSTMEHGEESTIPLHELHLLLASLKAQEDRVQQVNPIDPVTTPTYQDHQSALDALQQTLDSMSPGEQSPVPIDEVKDTLRDMTRCMERQKSMPRMEDPLTSKVYLTYQDDIKRMTSEYEALPHGKECPISLDSVKQEIWDMKSKTERRKNMEHVEDPLKSDTYKKRQHHITERKAKADSLPQGQETDIQHVIHTLLDFQTKLSRQNVLVRVPEFSPSYHERKQRLQCMQDNVDRMEKGVESPVPLNEVRQQLATWSGMEMGKARYVTRIQELQDEITQKEQQLPVCDDDTDYQAQMEQTKRRHQWVTERLAVPTQLIKTYTTYAQEFKQYMTYRTLSNDIHEKRRLCAIYYSQLEQLDSLMQHMIQAEGICLEQFIRRVNQKMKYYLEHFFPDASLQMELRTEKETKTGKIKNEMCVALTHHNQPTDLKYLSGGEYDRCALALMLAINELAHSPFLFLDESISSLDMTLSEDVLEVIKEKQTELKKMVLIISHQANTGFFDHVVGV